MLQFDSSSNTLYAYRNKCAIPDVSNVPKLTTKVYEQAYQYFYDPEWLRKDVEEVWFPEFRAACGAKEGELEIEDIRIHVPYADEGFRDALAFNDYYETQDWIDYMHKDGIKVDRTVKVYVEVKFRIPGFTNCEYMPVLRLPYVREDGVIEYNHNEYAFIHILEQTDGISYSKSTSRNKPDKIELRTNRNAISIEESKSGIMLKLDKTNYELITIISAMLLKENYDATAMAEVWDEFADNAIAGRYDTTQGTGMIKWYYSGGSTNGRSTDYILDTVTPKLRAVPSVDFRNNRFDASHLREELNNVLSLNQAINKILYKDVVTKDGLVLARKGTLLDAGHIRNFQQNGIYVIYVENDVKVVGAVLAHDVIIKTIPIGTLVTPEIENAFPEEVGMYTIYQHNSSDYLGTDAESAFIIDKGSIITEDILTFIKQSGDDYVDILDGKKVIRNNFYTEIMSNKQFKGEWIGKEMGKWYYMDAYGNYIEPATNGYTAYDFIALWSYAVKAFRGDDVIKLPNIDEDFRKNLVPINEQYRRALAHAAVEGSKQMKNKFSELWRGETRRYFAQSDSELQDKVYAYEARFWDYLTKTIKCVRQIALGSTNNPIIYESELTKANVYIASKNSINDRQRRIAMSSYGRLDPYECPQSQKIGIVNNLTTYADIDMYGKVRTPYYKVYHEGSKSRIGINEKYTYLTVEEEEKYIIGDISSIDVDDDGNILTPNDTVILARVPGTDNKTKQNVDNVKVSQLQLVNVNAIQSLSWASAAIPFLSNNDAARAVFAVAQMKQAKGLESVQEPLVRTSAYRIYPRLNSKFGFVCDKDMWLYECNIDHRTKRRRVKCSDKMLGDPTARTCFEAEYEDWTIGDNSVYYHYPRIKDNDAVNGLEVHEGQTVIETNFVSENGIMQFGMNAFVLMIPDGYNYEDSAHISVGFANDVISYRMNEEVLPIRPAPRCPRVYRLANGESLDSSIMSGPVEKGYDNNGFMIRYKGDRGKNESVTKYLKHAYGDYISSYATRNDQGLFNGVCVQLLSRDTVQMGDKFSNRHGNKCTVCRISPHNEMPQIHSISGDGAAPKQVDMCLNPLGVGSRMNIGQIKELHLGFICYLLGIATETDAYNCLTDIELKTLLSFVYDIANETQHYREMPKEQTLPNNWSSVVNKPEYSIIPDSLKERAAERFDQIQDWRGCFNKKGNFYYYYWVETEMKCGDLVDENGSFVADEFGWNEETKDKPLRVRKLRMGEAVGGFMYMFKLTQESYKKVHARANDMSGEEYAKMTAAPTHGKARGGGQRMGTMEIDALCAYDAGHYISELVNERSDNDIRREQFNMKTYFDPKLVKGIQEEGDKNEQDSFGQRRAVTRLLYTLLALGIYTDADDGEIIELSNKNGFELSHVKGSYLQREVGRVHRKNDQRQEDTTGEDTANTSEEIPERLDSSVVNKAFSMMKFEDNEEEEEEKVQSKPRTVNRDTIDTDVKNLINGIMNK